MKLERQIGVGGLGVGEELVQQLGRRIDAGGRHIQLVDAPLGVRLVRSELQIALGPHERRADIVGERREIALELLLVPHIAHMGIGAAVELVVDGGGELGHARHGAGSNPLVALWVALAQQARKMAHLHEVAGACEKHA